VTLGAISVFCSGLLWSVSQSKHLAKLCVALVELEERKGEQHFQEATGEKPFWQSQELRSKIAAKTRVLLLMRLPSCSKQREIVSTLLVYSATLKAISLPKKNERTSAGRNIWRIRIHCYRDFLLKRGRKQ
jgi:hypothetical protein